MGLSCADEKDAKRAKTVEDTHEPNLQKSLNSLEVVFLRKHEDVGVGNTLDCTIPGNIETISAGAAAQISCLKASFRGGKE